jgi:3-deoxy-manno-octulosonate cytidylyltransferase (CMP-KDO synthetase)
VVLGAPQASPPAAFGEDSAVAVIPARFASTRFPGKTLASETGRPLVQHVVDRVRECRLISEVIVAADDDRIAEALEPFGTRCVMTSPEHPSGTDRVAEVARGLEAPIVINVQGDEPEIEPVTVDTLVGLMRHVRDAPMATLATAFAPGDDPADPNYVKVVLAPDGKALYFSRSLIPFDRDGTGDVRPLLHIGLYGYRRDFLLQLASYSPTPLEKSEKLEQLRVLEHGHSIYAAVVSRPSHGIDTPEQYRQFVKRYQAQPTPPQGG